MKSGIFSSDPNEKNYGGVHSFYNEKEKQYGFLYPEITGYFISTMRFLNSQLQEDVFLKYAKSSSDWLINIYEKYGSIIQGINSRSNKNLSYSFDSAMCAKGLLDFYEMNKEKKYLDYANRILTDIQNEAFDSDGSIKPFKDITANRYQESNQIWYKQKGCLHIKIAMAYFQSYKITNDKERLNMASKICEKISSYQNSDGSIRLHQNSKTINLHTMSYALEGMIYGIHVTKNNEYRERCRQAVDWCIEQINNDGSISLWFNSRHHSKAAYPIAQLVRIMILLDKLDKNSDYKSQILRLHKFLITLQASSNNSHVNGGFHEEFYKTFFGWKKRMKINSWTSMFALQAIFWLEHYDNLSFEDAVKYLY